MSPVNRKPSLHLTPSLGQQPTKASSCSYLWRPIQSHPVWGCTGRGWQQAQSAGRVQSWGPAGLGSSGRRLSPPFPSPKRTPLLPPSSSPPSRDTASARRPCPEPRRQPASARSALGWDLKAAAQDTGLARASSSRPGSCAQGALRSSAGRRGGRRTPTRAAAPLPRFPSTGGGGCR